MSAGLLIVMTTIKPKSKPAGISADNRELFGDSDTYTRQVYVGDTV